MSPVSSGAGDLLVADPEPAAVAVQVAPQEYARLLGMPRSRPLEGPLAQRAEGARAWYATHARPAVVARRLAVDRVGAGHVVVGPGVSLASATLAARFRNGDARAMMVVAVTAGPEVDEEVDRLWSAGLPDEAYFLDRFGAVVAETLVRWAMVWTCRRSEPQRETVLPHLSPGCGDWGFDDQRRLMKLVGGGEAAVGPLSMMDSGMLRPKNSLLAAFGVTRGTVRPSPADACVECDRVPCSFRRVAPRRQVRAPIAPGSAW